MPAVREPEKRLVFSQSEIEDRVKALALQISHDYEGREPILIGVLNGVFMFFADLVKSMRISVIVDFIRLASYCGGTSSTGRISMRKDVELDLTGRDVIIVEDIADSGLTLEFLRKHLEGMGAASVKVCVLVNKLERRDVPVELDYVGFEVTEGFLIGYGLDYDERYRHLPAIYHLETT